MKIFNFSFYADYSIAEKKLFLVHGFTALKAKGASNRIV